MLLVIAQAVRVTISWFFGQAVNALQVHEMAGMIAARNYLLLMLAAVGVAWTMHGPARILERFTALEVRERFADALHAKLLAFPTIGMSTTIREILFTESPRQRALSPPSLRANSSTYRTRSASSDRLPRCCLSRGRPVRQPWWATG